MALTVGIVVGSMRAERVCPQVARFVHDILQRAPNNATTSEHDVVFRMLDIAAFELPQTLQIPSQLSKDNLPVAYRDHRCRAWSSAVTACDAFVFVTPQYNWGIPSGLKNAIDHLFHEWTGKVAMVVAYGGHGGTLSAAQLITVLRGLFMNIPAWAVCMRFMDRQMTQKAFNGADLGLHAGGSDSPWTSYRNDILRLWSDMLQLASEKGEKTRSQGLGKLWETTIAEVEEAERGRTR